MSTSEPAPWTSLISAREAAGVSRYRLAQKMHINLSHLGELERGKSFPRADTVRRAAEALGVTVEQVTPTTEDTTLVVTVKQLREIIRDELARHEGAVPLAPSESVIPVSGDIAQLPRTLWGVYLNTDMTEGRGVRYLARVFRTEDQARRWVDTQTDYPGHPLHNVAEVDMDFALVDAPEGLPVPRYVKRRDG